MFQGNKTPTGEGSQPFDSAETELPAGAGKNTNTKKEGSQMETSLYHGDNIISPHEFWENEKGDIVIMRNRSEKWWQVYLVERWKGAPDAHYVRLGNALNYVNKKMGIKCVLDKGRKWIQPANKNANMILVFV